MGLFGKLKEILFDEETVEIPVITKEELDETRALKKKKEEPIKEEKKKVIKEERATREEKKDDDEVIIRKIETPKKTKQEPPLDSEDLFDMPKLKSEEPKKERKINTFTFPVFDDEMTNKSQKRSDRKKEAEKIEEPRKKERKAESNKGSGYTNAYDYSYGKYKGDYLSSRESNQEVLTKTLEEKETKHAFTPSPIISPVYGVLNENYKKEDIKSKKEVPLETSQALDLDSVRRKAYGTLEEEIEESLSRTDEFIINNTEEEPEEAISDLDDKGLSIDDLLVDEGAEDDIEDEEEIEIEPTIETIEDTELFDDLNDELDETIIEEDKPKEKERKPELDTTGPKIPDDAEEIKIEKTSETDSSIKEEDLFDLIDSLYEGKGEE